MSTQLKPPLPSDTAILDAINRMLIEKRPKDAAAVAEALRTSGGDMAWLGHVASASLALRRKDYPGAHSLLTAPSDRRSLTLRPDLYLASAFGISRASGLAAYLDLMTSPKQIGTVNRLRMVRVLVLNHCIQEAKGLISLTERKELRGPNLTSLLWLDKFLNDSQRSQEKGNITLGVIDYKAIDYGKTSTNIGDPIQTLAFLGNLARFSNIVYRGNDDLDAIMTSLQARVTAPLKDTSRAGEVRLVRVNRDSSSYEEIPEGTWLFAFGWYMHMMFANRYDLPFHPNIRPIFISFHVNNPKILTDAAIEQMKRYGPVGCRDWSTVSLLRSKGIPAFFTGCITTTMGTLLRQNADAPSNGMVGVVEARTKAGEFPAERLRTTKHGHPESRPAPLAENLRTAMAKLSGYCELSRVVTSRLHCYLPCLAMGIPVDFRPKKDDDIRFAGLRGLTPENIGNVRDPILRLMNVMLGNVLAGGSEEEVYAAWRRETEPLTQLASPQ